ncbi:Transposase [Aquiflexum balticum DSM 16537]|uniref:Transposase n=1 Tax=Aquiflexum balticum DSM 16537 TaxID=758820 RepID=A0A1W2H2Q8_9BACT|nr:IS1634 family transposase [Aquiflexum balticum]SMD42898.1 Transposase [Aquiflexum balticum DSM 16537]SMD46107.1 Transposase [Aquiflexum balticum DSM 16537]
MFVRKKPNKSGKISVQVIDKIKGRYKVAKTIGSSSDNAEVEELVSLGEEWIRNYKGILDIPFNNEEQVAESVLESVENITVSGTELLLDNVFNDIGFNVIQDDIFKWLVYSRICFPASKLKTCDYLQTYHGLEFQVQDLYRYMDKLYNNYKEIIQLISFGHTKKILGGSINIVFYDCTTLYFEVDQEDDLRKTGFSKEGKHQNPQIVLGLLVGLEGYPLAYEIFEGNKFEGHTMIPVIETFRKKYSLPAPIVVADSGLLSKSNIKELLDNGYEFILGARLKSSGNNQKEKVLALRLENGESVSMDWEESLRMVVSYSERRAGKDRINREKGLKKLEKQLKKGKLNKTHINNRGYNKYLKMEGEIKIALDMDKFEQDGQWDGLKGYITNTKLDKEQVIENYNNLWKIEKAFRITKNEIKVRPVYHYKQRRIEAHISIAFVAYKVYKELERQLNEKGIKLSPQKAIEIAKGIYTVEIQLKSTGKKLRKTLFLNESQKKLAKMFGF